MTAYPPRRPRCECADLYEVHEIKHPGPPEIRGRCNAGRPSGPCPCRHYTPNERTDQP